MKIKHIISISIIAVAVVLCIVFNKISNQNKRKEYNLYAVNGTLPTLIVGLDLVNSNDAPGFLWYAREGTFDKKIISKYMPNTKLSKSIGNYESVFTELPIEMREYVKDILKSNPNAHFNLIVDDYRNWLEFPVFLELGLDDNQYSVRYYSDGTLSYVAEYDILKKESYDLFEREKEKYFQTISNTRDGLNKCQEKCDYLINEEIGDTKGLMDYEYDSNYILLATLRENVKYYLQYPELIKFQDHKINTQMEKANIKKIVIRNKFDDLSIEEKNMFFEMIGLDKKKFDKEYFNSDNNKYLIITGTKPFYGQYKPSEFYKMIDKIVLNYGNDYKILFKPHPSALPTDDTIELFDSKNIEILPGKMPMEAITFVYDGLKLGGFPSSLYMSASAEDTLFFFADSKENLVSPLNQLYDQLFSNAEIISRE